VRNRRRRAPPAFDQIFKSNLQIKSSNQILKQILKSSNPQILK
jgi:hypothetical protein